MCNFEFTYYLSCVAKRQTPLRYPARIALTATQIRTEHGDEPLQPGMSVSAEIKTGERTVMEFLLSPVVEVVSKAGRER